MEVEAEGRKAGSGRLLSILMPVYNESRTLRTIMSRVLNSPISIPFEVVCVDDCSRDDSYFILLALAEKDSRLRVVRHSVNQGKGAAVHTAIAHMKGDLAVVQDADLEYDPADIPAVLAPLLEGKADAVFGSRFAYAPQRKVLFFWHEVANRILTLMTNVLNDVNLTDMETCYKAVRSDILKQIPLQNKRFGLEPELTTRLAQWNIRLYEVPVNYHGRTYAEGKKIGLKDAFEAVWCLIWFRFIDPRFTTHDGYYMLESVRRSRGYNKWVYSLFAPHLGKRVLQTACGIGNFAELVLDRTRLVCVDDDAFFVEMVQRRFGHMENVRIERVAVDDPASYDRFVEEKLDTALCVNLLEHADDAHEGPVLKKIHDTLQPGGKAIVLVPAHQDLFHESDRFLGHYRRYSAAQLRSRLEAAGFEVVEVREYNRLGAWGWWLNKIRGVTRPSPGQVHLFGWLTPIARMFDALRLGRGSSLMAVGRKKA